MKAMHEAAEHDKWFKAQVEIGLADMQAGRVVSAEAVSSRWADKRAELLKKAEAHASS
jgi:predicted transcriptional regulator